MSSTHLDNPITKESLDYPLKLLATARRRPILVLAPLGMAMLAGILVALFGSKSWRATQSFLVREELIGRIVSPGRFESLDTMKTAQETIQEIARNPSVIRQTLITAGPASGKPSNDWPSDSDIESMQGAVSFFPPGGAEFGKTEVLMLTVTADSRQRAKQLAAVLFQETQSELRRVRSDRASSMQQEIGKAVELAVERLAETADNLGEIETAVGEDLPDLRAMSESSAASANLKNMHGEIQAEIRGARAQRDLYLSQLQHLQETRDNPTELLATPKELLELQPALSRLKDSLIDAQIRQSNLRGVYTNEHPSVISSANAVKDIKSEIHAEVDQAILGVQSQIRVVENRLKKLRENSDRIVARLQQLAKIRVSYAQLQAELSERTTELARVRSEFAQAESIRRAAAEVDFVTPIDEPRVGTQPEGMSKKAIVLCATLAGGMIGLGFLVMLTPFAYVPSPRPTEPPDQYEATARAAEVSKPVERPTASPASAEMAPAPVPIPKSTRPDALTLKQVDDGSSVVEDYVEDFTVDDNLDSESLPGQFTSEPPSSADIPVVFTETSPEIVHASGETFITETTATDEVTDQIEPALQESEPDSVPENAAENDSEKSPDNSPEKTPDNPAEKTPDNAAENPATKKPTIFVIPDLSQHADRGKKEQ